MKTMIDVLIPVRNEEANVSLLVRRLDKSLAQANLHYSLIFVDDHSTDKTFSLLKKLQKKFPIQLYSKKGQRGKAYSILEAARYAKAEYVAMIDADLQYPPEAIPEMYQQASTL